MSIRRNKYLLLFIALFAIFLCNSKNFVTITNQVELTVEDRVLNESSRLLAQNLAQTMDEVTRDVLASTSSVLQCSNGVNGRSIAVVKSLVIDLEAYGVSYGDRAQAGEYLRAA